MSISKAAVSRVLNGERFADKPASPCTRDALQKFRKNEKNPQRGFSIFAKVCYNGKEAKKS